MITEDGRSCMLDERTLTDNQPEELNNTADTTVSEEN